MGTLLRTNEGRLDETDGAAHVTDANPLVMATPTINGATAGVIQVDGVGTASFVPNYVLVTVNPGDDVTAAARLKAGYPECKLLSPGDALEISALSAITAVYMVAIDATAAAPANYTGNAYVMAKADTSAANWLAQMCRLDFSSTDDVRKVVISTSPVYATNYMSIGVEGFRHE